MCSAITSGAHVIPKRNLLLTRKLSINLKVYCCNGCKSIAKTTPERNLGLTVTNINIHKNNWMKRYIDYLICIDHKICQNNS